MGAAAIAVATARLLTFYHGNIVFVNRQFLDWFPLSASFPNKGMGRPLV